MLAHDGSHRHSSERICTDEKALKMMAEHLRRSPKCRPADMTKGQIPIHFITRENKPNEATLVCGICRAELGTCIVSFK